MTPLAQSRPWLRVGIVVLLLAGLLVAPGRQTPALGSVADSMPENTYVTNGPVEAVVRAGDTIYIGGRFSRVGPRTGPGLEFALDGTQNAGLPEVTGGGGIVQAVVSDGSGGWYIGGQFTHVGGIARSNIAHISADGSVDPAFNPSADGAVRDLVLSGSTIYMSGLFTSIGGQTRNRIAAVDVSDGTATAFNPNADAAVEALAVSSSGSIIYAGGRFTTIGGQTRLSMAALNAADGSATPTFNPSPMQTNVPSPGTVRALAISGSTLYVGGSFGMIGGQPRNNIAALNTGGTQDGVATSFNPDARSGTCAACGGVDALAVSGSTVYAGGLFTTIGGVARKYLAGLDPTSGAATPFNPNPNGNILGLAVSLDGSTVYAAGGFNSFDGLPSIGGQVRNYLAAINSADGTVTSFNPNPNNAALAVGVSDSAVYVGGSFSSIGGVVRNGIAAIDATDGTATNFNPNAKFGANNATVYALAVSGATVYAGGYFNSIGGQPRNYIAALDAADGTATSWNPGANSIVQTLEVSDSVLYAGGWFNSIGGQSRNYIAALNLSDGLPTPFNPSANSGVETIEVAGALVYAGGFFTSIGGQTRNKIAALKLSDGSATSWNPDATANANVLALAVAGSTIYAGGNFATIGGQVRKNIAALNASDGMATSFDPQASDGVSDIAVLGSTVYAAGHFATIGGQTRHLVAGLDPTDGTATGFDPGGTPGFGAYVLTVAPDGTLYVGGSFRTFDRAFQQGFASFTGPPLPAPEPTASQIPTESPTPIGPGATYYFHSLSGDNTLDQTLEDGATFDTDAPTWGPDAYSTARDLPGFQNAGLIEVVDPTWRGSLDAPASSVSVDFWGEQIPDQDLGTAHYTVRVLPAGATAYLELLPPIAKEDVDIGVINVKHTFTSMRTSATAPATPLQLPAGALTFTIRGTFVDTDVSTEVFFDSTNYPASFTTNGGGGADPTVTASPTSTATTSPSPTATPTPTPAACGNYPVVPNDTLWVDGGITSPTSGGQWGIRKISAPQAWQEVQATGCGIKVAVLDTGLDVGDGNDIHPDFDCAGKVEILPGTDFIQSDDIPNDQNGHGSHVAGIIGACTNNDEGVAGVAPDATILPVRVLDAQGSGDAAGLAAGITKAADSGAHVINMSLGFESALAPIEIVDSLFPEIDAAIEYARSKGVVVVAAAGNQTFPICAVPAIAEDVICVGSSDTRDLNAWYGNFPAKHDADEDFGPGLLAPGGSGVLGQVFCQQSDEEIISTWLRAGDACGDAGYQAIAGTSMASPHVAGVAALVYNRLNGERTTANGRAVVDAIIDNAVDLYSSGYDPISGYGRLNALAAVRAVTPVVTEPNVLDTSVSFTGDSAQSGQYTDEVTIAGRLVDEAGVPIGDAELSFELVGAAGTTEWTATTDATGVASVKRELTEDPGDYQLFVHYAGVEGTYEPSSNTMTFVALKETTEQALHVTGNGSKRTLEAHLVEDDGPAVTGATIVFFADGTHIGDAITDRNGRASLAVPPRYRGKGIRFESRFDPTHRYEGSTAQSV